MRRVALVILLVLVLAACGSKDDNAGTDSNNPAASTTTAAVATDVSGSSTTTNRGAATSTSIEASNTAEPSTSAAGTSTTTAASTSGSSNSTAVPDGSAPTPTSDGGTAGSACTSGSAPAPTGASVRKVIDVDGDGKADSAWLDVAADGKVTVGITAAAGGGMQRVWDSASPVVRSILVVRPNEATPPLVLADDGRSVNLWAVVDCKIGIVTDSAGAPYTFSHGFTDFGTGVGCDQVAGTNQLVGLNITDQADDAITWTSTVVSVRGLIAKNGAQRSGTYERPADSAAIERLAETTCGDQTIENAGLSVVS